MLDRNLPYQNGHQIRNIPRLLGKSNGPPKVLHQAAHEITIHQTFSSQARKQLDSRQPCRVQTQRCRASDGVHLDTTCNWILPSRVTHPCSLRWLRNPAPPKGWLKHVETLFTKWDKRPTNWWFGFLHQPQWVVKSMASRPFTQTCVQLIIALESHPPPGIGKWLRWAKQRRKYQMGCNFALNIWNRCAV